MFILPENYSINLILKYLFPGNFRNKSALLHQSQHGKKKTRKAAIVLFSENPKNQAINCQIIFFLSIILHHFWYWSSLICACPKSGHQNSLSPRSWQNSLEEDSVILGQTSNQNTKAASLIPQFLLSLQSLHLVEFYSQRR